MFILTTYDGVPARPTARLTVVFEKSDGSLVCLVREGDQENIAVRLLDGEFTFPFGASDNMVGRLGLAGVSTDEEAACLCVLQRSDAFCPRQARSDFPSAKASPFWKGLLDDMRALHPAAAVMLS